jgi:RimJ/RimL family protein N-acetyltransferase
MEQSYADAQNKPLYNMLGEKVALGPLHKGILPALARWQNDFSVTLMSGDPLHPVTPEAIEAEFDRSVKDVPNRFIPFAIYERASARLIGTADLHHIDYTRRTAYYGILIGEKDCWGKGYGTETTRLMLDYAFAILGLHTVLLSTYNYNERAIRAYTRAGFRVVGKWREAHRLGNEVYDIVFMDCLASEFHFPARRVVDIP